VIAKLGAYWNLELLEYFSFLLLSKALSRLGEVYAGCALFVFTGSVFVMYSIRFLNRELVMSVSVLRLMMKESCLSSSPAHSLSSFFMKSS
jgi:hypothetical protein